ncbi:MAG: hypothetical protein K2X42_00445 [Burkholderiaceae bacterium]|nr:hypothetical protein [Burkholderiaceae bacterium]
MSFCAGWKFKGAVCLWADAAATQPLLPTRRQLSLGELHTEPPHDCVGEPTLRLQPIAPDTAVACAGDVDLSTQIVAFLKAHQGDVFSHPELLQRMEQHLGPFSADRSVALLLASSTGDGGTELLCWTTAEGLDTARPDFCQIGEPAKPHHAVLTPELRAALAASDLTAERLMPVVTAMVQSCAVRDGSIDMNLGGLVFGLRTDGGSLRWQEDTVLVLYDADFASSTQMVVLPRADELVVRTSDSPTTRVFAPAATTPRGPSRPRLWLHGLQAELDADRFRHRVFISRSEPLVTIIIRIDLERESRYVRLGPMRQGRFEMALSPELTSLLLRPLQDRSLGGLPMQVSVRED